MKFFNQYAKISLVIAAMGFVPQMADARCFNPGTGDGSGGDADGEYPEPGECGCVMGRGLCNPAEDESNTTVHPHPHPPTPAPQPGAVANASCPTLTWANGVSTAMPAGYTWMNRCMGYFKVAIPDSETSDADKLATRNLKASDPAGINDGGFAQPAPGEVPEEYASEEKGGKDLAEELGQQGSGSTVTSPPLGGKTPKSGAKTVKTLGGLNLNGSKIVKGTKVSGSDATTTGMATSRYPDLNKIFGEDAAHEPLRPSEVTYQVSH